MSSDIAPTLPFSHTGQQITRIEKEIRCVEEEVHRRLALLSNLRAKRNSLLPVFHLPPETLEAIFIHVARDYYESEDGGLITPHIPAWVNVSYVCKHWRDIALNRPPLWTYHFNTSLRWTKELLLRSKKALLKIKCVHVLCSEDSWWSSLLDELLKHSERIQELCLIVPVSFLPAQLSLCTPRIEELQIEVDFGEYESPIAITNTHRLRTLSLYNCHLQSSWCSLDLNGLEKLDLRYVDSPPPLYIVDVLTVLSGMQALTTLCLHHCLLSARDQDFLSSGGLRDFVNIDLPHLTCLAIREPLSTVAALLSCINIPPKTRLVLDLVFEDESCVDYIVLISSFIAQRFTEQLTGPVLALQGGNLATLAVGLEHSSAPSFYTDHTFKITLEEFPTEFRWNDAQGILLDMCCRLPLASIQKLHVFDLYHLSSDSWKKILGCLDGLRCMKLKHCDMPDLSFLSLVTPESNKNGQSIPGQDPTSSHVFVPKLEELELEYITFAPDGTSEPDRMSQKSLFDTLSTRKGLRDRLVMDNCRQGDQ